MDCAYAGTSHNDDFFFPSSFAFAAHLMSALNVRASNTSNTLLSEQDHHPPAILLSFVFYNLS